MECWRLILLIQWAQYGPVIWKYFFYKYLQMITMIKEMWETFI